VPEFKTKKFVLKNTYTLLRFTTNFVCHFHSSTYQLYTHYKSMKRYCKKKKSMKRYKVG